MRALAIVAIAVFLVPMPHLRDRLLAYPSDTDSNSLFAQSAARKLEGEVANCPHASLTGSMLCSSEVSFLLLDAHTGALLASRWPDPAQPIPLGSLVKPITALAYGEEHQFRYPTYVCHGTASGCWLPRGHGIVGVVSAIEHSCNSYFRMMTAEMTAADVAPVAQSLGLQTPEPGASGIALAGIGDHWQISPLSMARAYVELARRREQPGIRQIVYGMEESAERGTGAEIDRALGRADAVVKTGTAPCTHSRHGVGDGFVIALVPAADPQILLMVRVHGVPGALAARTAGQMLRDIEE